MDNKRQINQDDYILWLSHPVTEILFKVLTDKRNIDPTFIEGLYHNFAPNPSLLVSALGEVMGRNRIIDHILNLKDLDYQNMLDDYMEIIDDSRKQPRVPR